MCENNKKLKVITSDCIKHQPGYSLVEVVVSMGIFVMMIFAIGGTFQNVIIGQQHTIVAQEIQESINYVFEKMSKEIRQAQRSDKECEATYPADLTAINRTFNIGASNDELFYMNKKGECIRYFVDGNSRLVQSADGTDFFATPNNVEINNISFSINDNRLYTTPGSKIQPWVSIKMEVVRPSVKAQLQKVFNFQTTISSRLYE